MKRIAIIGPSGTGKTTLAKELERIHKIKIYHLDRVFWGRGWKDKDRDKRIDILQKIVREKQWIIEGFYLKSSLPRLEAADTIIFLDLPPLLCLLRLIKRHFYQKDLSRRDIPLECSDKLSLRLILKILTFLFRERKLLNHLLDKYKKERDVLYLSSSEAVALFLAQQEQHAAGKLHDKPIPTISAHAFGQTQLTPVLSS